MCTEVTIEDGVMVSAGTIFTNDRLPRATTPDLKELRSSAPDEHTLQTQVREGATIGAGCVIGPGLDLGAHAMIGMGSVVTHDVLPLQLVYGNPARLGGYVCVCGEVLIRALSTDPDGSGGPHTLFCNRCGRSYYYKHDRAVPLQLVQSPFGDSGIAASGRDDRAS